MYVFKVANLNLVSFESGNDVHTTVDVLVVVIVVAYYLLKQI